MIKPRNTPFDDGDTLEEELESIDFESLPATPVLNDLSEKVSAFFDPAGPLRDSAVSGGRPYEFRPQQLAMGRAIAEAFAGGKNLCVEAPTGVGKSFAYLIPLIYRARSHGKAAVISTETIHLQEQLIHKDIPLLQKLTGENFKAVLAKGRSNYLCLRRFELLSGDQRDSLLPIPSMALELTRIDRWRDDGDGERSSANFRISTELWSMIASESGNCLGPQCPHYRDCFYFKARNEWEKADIIVANHALFFTDMRIRLEGEESGLLPDYGAVVIDEAHTLEDNAADYLGLYVSRASVVSFLNRLYNPDNAKGLLLKDGEKAMNIRKMISDLRDESYGFFKNFEEYLKKENESCVRIREGGLFPDTLSRPLGELHEALGEYAEDQEDASFRSEIESYRLRCAGLIDGIIDFLAVSKPEHVYYIESERTNLILRGAPLNVPDLLRRQLFDRSFPVVLSSATLSVKGEFDYYIRRIGFDNGITLSLDSPFDPACVRAFVPRDIVEPQHPDYQKQLISYIEYFLKISHGKAFVLFTSYSALRQTADAMRGFFEENKLKLLIQGEDLTRSAMLKEFKEDVDSVIFGTDSFWTGVDVPGEALSNVIITKLPFAVPSHPLIAARSEEVEKNGGSSFRDYSIPEAVLKFRQGVGRLIRSRTDTGIIAVLDKRIISKGYGKIFQSSIPYRLEII